MGGLAHYLESEGVPTTQISLIRMHTEKIRPPRALWVPFELGRPLGVPGDRAFQARVLLAVLRLLEAPFGPVLEDFAEEAAPAEASFTWACPVSLPPPTEPETETGQLAAAFLDEIEHLATWYHQAVRRQPEVMVGASGLEPQAIGRYLGGFLAGRVPPNPRPELSWPWLVKLAVEDLKAYYFKAVTAQPGQGDPGSARLTDWFWGETMAGRVLLKLYFILAELDDPEGHFLARYLLVPMSQIHRLHRRVH
ncbi:MAG: hypothetical protein HQK56_08345 [Deltaproteobacteria bacterium]|nr:hypothetical protein [Deltaproteobacteria bacterium]